MVARSRFLTKFEEPLLITLIFFVYFITAKLGLMLDAVSGFATLVWAPSGIALAAILLLGYRVWPAIAWAAFVINYQNGAPILSALGIATGNTLEAICATYLLYKLCNFDLRLNRQKNILWLIVAIITGAVVSATIGTLSTAFSKVTDWEGFSATWFAWFIGNTVGSLIVSPLILVWASLKRPYKISRNHLIECAIVGTFLFIIGHMVFGVHTKDAIFLFKFPYILFPFLIWSSLRFAQIGSTVMVLAITSISIWGTMHGFGPFVPGTFRENLYVGHSFIATLAAVGLFLSAAILERKKALEDFKSAEDKLIRSNVDLEKLIKNRTLELVQTNEQLEERVQERTAELFSAQERKTSIFESSLDCIITIDHDGKILEFNPAAEKTFGHTREQVLGLDMADIIIPERYRERHRKGMALYLSTGKGPVLGKRLELSAIKSDGSEFPVELSIVPLNIDGENFFTGFLRDITEQKKAAQELEAAKNNAEVANQTKSAFLANMSHEIRTPLGAILGFSELIIDPTISSSDKLNFMESIKRNGELLSNIINDILDLSKVEAGKLEIETRDTSLGEVLLDLVSLLKLRADEKGIALNISYDQSIPKTIRTDSLRLRQILINIVGNAIKFTEHGSVNVSVKLTENSQLAFIVKDTGYGIGPEQIPKLFQSFSQADISTKRKFGGTGLGLVLSKRLAKLLGGDLVLTESSLGKGSTFTITIDPGPIRETLTSELDPVNPNPSPRARLDETQILLVEDSSDNQLLVSRLLKNSGAQVDVAENGKVALEKINKKKYDIVLMDLQMPVMDGYQATQEIRKMGNKIPIIALTAHALKEERQYCLANGFNEHLTKPIQTQKLIETIRRLCNA